VVILAELCHLYRYRDRIVVSHGHTSAGVYSTLGRLGFFDIDEAISTFRLAGSSFEGHIERNTVGIDWGTGNLGQGLSAGCGFSLASRLHKTSRNVFVVMGDGEQQKGQIGEARRFAVKYNLNLIVLIDYNKLQLTGKLDDVMPQRIGENFESDGWNVKNINGHDFKEIYDAIRWGLYTSDAPTCIICETIMGKGFADIEDDFNYHGAPISEDMYEKASKDMGFENDLDRYKELRKNFTPVEIQVPKTSFPTVKFGSPITYSSDSMTDNRSAYGKVLEEIGKENEKSDKPIAAVFDCDLSSSVKTAGFAKISPSSFFQGGIQEHNTATAAGAWMKPITKNV